MSAQKLSMPRAVRSVAVAGALMVAVAWGTFLYASNWLTVYWNLGNSHVYAYLHPALYVVSTAAAVYGLAVGAGSMRSPGQGAGRFLVSSLLLLLALTVWACISTLLGRAYLD